MTGNHADDSAGRDLPVTRRRLLAAGGAVGATALAGCSAVVDFLAGLVLQDVNVFNGTPREMSGTIRVEEPNDEVVLDEAFTIGANEDAEDEPEANETNSTADGGTAQQDGEANESGTGTSNQTEGGYEASESTLARFEEVLTDAGEYLVSVDLDTPEAIENLPVLGEPIEKTVEVTAPDDEHIMVFLGTDDPNEPVKITVIEELSDLEEFDNQ